MKPSAIDLHMHSTASDGTDDPKTLMEKVRRSGIRIFSLTDHDSDAGAELLRTADTGELTFLPGIELSSHTGELLFHILGYGYARGNADLERAIGHVASLRRKKTEYRIDLLRKNRGIDLTKEETDWIFSQESPGRPHIADVLIRRGLASSTTDAFHRYLSSELLPVPPELSRIEASEAVRSIRSAGGVPCWAHPLGGEGEPHLSSSEFETRLETLLPLGIRALECYYSRYTEEEIRFLCDAAEKHGLLISGGSDYHGKKKNIPLGMLNCDGTPVPPEKLTILSELL